MDDILRELNLGTLVDRFNDEKVEVDTVISASDSELARLGVCTIGDRIRLRNLCKARKQEDSEVSHASTSNPRRQGRGASGSDSKRRSSVK